MASWPRRRRCRRKWLRSQARAQCPREVGLQGRFKISKTASSWVLLTESQLRCRPSKSRVKNRPSVKSWNQREGKAPLSSRRTYSETLRRSRTGHESFSTPVVRTQGRLPPKVTVRSPSIWRRASLRIVAAFLLWAASDLRWLGTRPLLPEVPCKWALWDPT